MTAQPLDISTRVTSVKARRYDPANDDIPECANCAPVYGNIGLLVILAGYAVAALVILAALCFAAMCVGIGLVWLVHHAWALIQPWLGA